MDVFKYGLLSVIARMERDDDSEPFDAECYTEDDILAWQSDDWSYVGIIVAVTFNGAKISEESLWGIEHGHMPSGYVNAMDDSPNSNLWRVAEETVSAAVKWCQSAGPALENALAHFSPTTVPAVTP